MGGRVTGSKRYRLHGAIHSRGISCEQEPAAAAQICRLQAHRRPAPRIAAGPRGDSPGLRPVLVGQERMRATVDYIHSCCRESIECSPRTRTNTWRVPGG